jgi:hypothetical protein
MKIKKFTEFSFGINERLGTNKSVEKLTAYFNYKIMNEMKNPSEGQRQSLVPGLMDGKIVLAKHSSHEFSWTKEELKNDPNLSRFGLLDDEIFNTIEEWVFVFYFLITKHVSPKVSNAALHVPTDNNGKIIDNVVIITFNIEVDKDGSLREKELRNEIKSILNHELHHVLQRNVNRTTPIMMSKSHSLNFIKNILSNNEGVAPELKDFLYIIYLHLDSEVDARVAQLYTEAKTKRFKKREDFETWLIKSMHKEFYDMMNNFDGDVFYKEIIEVATTQGASKEDLDKYLRSFIKQFRDSDGQVEELKSIYSVNKNIPANPIGFFKHFENRFKETAKSYWKRCLRVWMRLQENRK